VSDVKASEAARYELATYAQLAKAWGVAPKTVANWVHADRRAGYRIATIPQRGRLPTRVRVLDALALFDRHLAPRFVFVSLPKRPSARGAASSGTSADSLPLRIRR
jgi:hypothetical protein